MIFGYLRVSTRKQDIQSQKHAIMEYAHKEKIIIDEFIEVESSSRKSQKDRKIDVLLKKVKEGDRLICSEMSRLGRSALEMLNILEELNSKKINISLLKENIHIKGGKPDQLTKFFLMFTSIVCEAERDAISYRTKNALALAKERGKQIGRKKGWSGSKLDIHKSEIIDLLKMGASKKFISNKFECSTNTLYLFIKRNHLL